MAIPVASVLLPVVQPEVQAQIVNAPLPVPANAGPNGLAEEVDALINDIAMSQPPLPDHV